MSKPIVLRLDLNEAERQALLAGLLEIKPDSVRRFMSASDLEQLIHRLRGREQTVAQVLELDQLNGWKS